MDLLHLYIVILTLSSITWSFECPKNPKCGRCPSLHPERESESLCTISNETAFKVRILPRASVAITCLHDLDWKYFSLGTKKSIEYINKISFEHCNLPETGLAAVTKQLLVKEVSILSFESLKNETSLTKETLRGFNNIQKLLLRSNNLSNLTEDLLEDLRNLTSVDLQKNNLEKVPENFFRNSNLQTIHLGSNRLKTLQVLTFDRLANLRSLNISHNELRNLLPQTFDNLTSLDYLNMNGNFLESLPEEIFKKMPKLIFLHMAHNNFTGKALNKKLLEDKNKLVIVSMSDNKRNMTDLPSGFFANLTSLAYVNLTNDGLNHLPEDLFWGTPNLMRVTLARNFLKTLPSMIFKDATSLIWLDLSFNNLSCLRDDVFKKLSKLEFLDLSVNHLTNISE